VTEQTDDTTLKQALLDQTVLYAGIDGVAGYEQDVVRRLRDDLEPHVDRVFVDPFGNLVGTIDGPEGAPSLMVSAHSDEIGGVVKAIEPDGQLRFEKMGGVIETLLVGRMVRVRGQRGVIGAKAGHVTPPAERLTAPPVRDLYIDLGYDTAEAVRAAGVQVGDPIAYESDAKPMANGERIVGKALDNRVCCAMIVELARRLKGARLDCTLHLVVAVQEEVGLRGAQMITHRLNPTAAIVVDTMPSGGTPDVSATRDLPMVIGAGPVITLVSHSGGGGAIGQPAMRDLLLAAAEGAGIQYQRGIFYGGNSDAAAVHLVRDGIPTGIVNIARRYAHSPVEVIDLNDAVGTFQLLEASIRAFGPQTDLGFL
jgi:endoglucanase